MESELAIILPTFKRASRIPWIERNIRDHTPESYSLYFVIDAIDEESKCVLDELCSKCPNVHYFIDTKQSSNTAINLGVKLTKEPYIYTAFDDNEFTEGWYKKAKYEFTENPHAMVIGTWDFFTRGGNAGFLVKREYIDTVGGVVGELGTLFYEGYHHLYADEEFVKTAQGRGVFVHSESAVVLHHHFSLSSKYSSDQTYTLGESKRSEDAEVYRQRKMEIGL